MWLRRRIRRSFAFQFIFTDSLCTMLSLSEIAKALNIAKSTASDHIQQLERDGVIKIENLPASESENGKEHSLYILGTRTENGEHWFIDDVFSGEVSL